jgi:ABC-type Na+ transport system ATPase subunit NatA
MTAPAPTIINILATLLATDEGEIRVAGFDVRREPTGVRVAIGVTGQFSARRLDPPSSSSPCRSPVG